ncbi:hypothetical protein [Lactobacillus brevis] [Lactiplantibacillus mudanjiangensis]|uniref:baseplate J/gp47 family protein n=1 Tax=Lactiplantibacillus mudanjiangensis TaxID=1296538 RepID=UPI0010159FFE|nr:baseplate J/gp47 family protein [Lactiplantibacillus mudanjiangensis]VDG32893.1 hypothetical protein [Lactobacillus brevis] [Lactiplantibacillus mudanjiangensis]
MELTKYGFDQPELDDIREEITVNAASKFGEQIATGDETRAGQLFAIMADNKLEITQLAHAVLLSIFLDSSTDETLDYHGTDEGITRKPELAATVYLQIDGDVGTEIPEGTEYSTDDGQIFSVLDDVKIIEVATVTDPDTQQPTDLLDEDGNAIGRVSVQAIAEEAGADSNVAANTIINEEEILDGVVAVTNPNAAVGGGDAETDTAYRARVKASRLSHSASADDGIKAAVENVAGVIQAKVVDNNTMETDQYGNPPKVVHIYVIGGADDEIAEAIRTSVALPGRTYGDITKTLVNLSGDERQISFSRASQTPVYFKLDVKTNDDFDSDGGPAALKQQVLDYVNTLRMGDTLLFSKVFEYVWKVPGISSVVVGIGKDKDDLSLQDITCNSFELLEGNAANIEVVLDD